MQSYMVCYWACLLLWIWSDLLKKSLMENFIFFCAMVDNNLSNKLFRSFYVIQL